jgi:hypothetical protein
MRTKQSVICYVRRLERSNKFSAAIVPSRFTVSDRQQSFRVKGNARTVLATTMRKTRERSTPDRRTTVPAASGQIMGHERYGDVFGDQKSSPQAVYEDCCVLGRGYWY